MKTNFASDITVLWICLGYALAVLLVWRYQVAAPRDWLLARIEQDKLRIPKGKDSLEDLQKKIAKPWPFVRASRVQAGWRLVHALEDDRELATDRVDEELRTALSRLSRRSTPESESLKKRIGKALESTSSLDLKRAVFREAKEFLHDESDRRYEDLAGLLIKAVWLTVVTLALIVALAVPFDRESFFLLGATGALISRLTRVLMRRPSASDYGAEWSTLILSPAGGALAGWIGVLIAVTLAGSPFDVLDDRFGEMWDDASDTLGLFVAFVSGFSERFFNRLLGTAESQVTGALPQNAST